MEKSIGNTRVVGQYKELSDQTKMLLQTVKANVANQIDYCEHQKIISDDPDTKRWLSMASTNFETACYWLVKAATHEGLQMEPDIISIEKMGNDLLLFKAIMSTIKRKYIKHLEKTKAHGVYNELSSDRDSKMIMDKYLEIRNDEMNELTTHIIDQIKNWTDNID